MSNFKSALPFFGLSVAFFAIGVSGQRAFIYVGITFFIISLLTLRRSRR
jgi:hypothetical protein